LCNVDHLFLVGVFMVVELFGDTAQFPQEIGRRREVLFHVHGHGK
jgi:hypothetical protein